jgi:hypothetical protein
MAKRQGVAGITWDEVQLFVPEGKGLWVTQ